jgi:outer membrane biosynthesis protein TonB
VAEFLRSAEKEMMRRFIAVLCIAMLSASCASDRGATTASNRPPATYDEAVYRKVQTSWYAVCRQNQIPSTDVTVQVVFQLDTEGHIHNSEVKANNDGTDLARYCLAAVNTAAPFSPLPESLRSVLTNDMRDVSFTFHY